MTSPRTALICGISGQDGAYLAQTLLQKGYRVIGAARDAQISGFANLERLDIRSLVAVVSMAIHAFRSVLQVMSRYAPTEVYYLAGQSSVGLSFEQSVVTLESISIGILNLLECLRFLNRDIRLYSAGSGECFGDTGNTSADGNTPFQPSSPYAVAKAATPDPAFDPALPDPDPDTSNAPYGIFNFGNS